MLSISDAETASLAIETLWQKSEPDLFITKDQFVRSFDGWECFTETFDGEKAFVAFVKGPEFHYASLNQDKPLTRKAIKEFLDSIIKKEGFAFTRTAKDDLRQQRFNELIGFKKVGEDEFFIHYKIESFRSCR